MAGCMMAARVYIKCIRVFRMLGLVCQPPACIKRVYLACPYVRSFVSFMYKILYHKRALGIFSYQKTHNVYTERGEEHIKTFRSRANKITHSTASTEFENERRHKKISNELAKNDKWLERLYFGIDGFLYFFVVCFAIEKSLVGYINMK